jgi:hypothetical protein
LESAKALSEAAGGRRELAHELLPSIGQRIQAANGGREAGGVLRFDIGRRRIGREGIPKLFDQKCEDPAPAAPSVGRRVHLLPVGGCERVDAL